jgi:hypothetical protein
MPRESHLEYYARRERECRDAADRAEDVALKQVYTRFAEQYASAIVRPEQSNAA